MTATTKSPARTFRVPQEAKRFGYFLALLINGAMIFVANNLLAWGWFSWLTAAFEELLPIINLSLAASMLVNAIYIVYDQQWFKSLTQIGVTVIAMVVAVRTWQVFPFDFSAYEFGWDLMARIVIGISLFGMGVGIIAEIAKLAKALSGTNQPTAV